MRSSSDGTNYGAVICLTQLTGQVPISVLSPTTPSTLTSNHVDNEARHNLLAYYLHLPCALSCS